MNSKGRIGNIAILFMASIVGVVSLSSAVGALPNSGSVTTDNANRTVTTSNIFVDWSNLNINDPEEINILKWNSTGLTANDPNLTMRYPSSVGCNGGDVEYFGNSWAPPDPQSGGKVLVGAGTKGTWSGSSNEVKIASNSVDCSNSAGVAVSTTYKFLSSNTFEVIRNFEFTTPFNLQFRPYIPRLFPAGDFSQTLHPDFAGTSLVTEKNNNCELGCNITNWNGNNAAINWFAIHDPVKGRGLIVKRTPSAFPVTLWVDQDGASSTAASSVLALQPSGGFSGTVTEEESFCFYDKTTWTPSLNLPSECTPDITPTPTPTPTPTITTTPIAPPLTVSITSPADNSYSEESVSFKGTISGGVPPYSTRWDSDKDGQIKSLGSTTNTLSSFNTMLSMNTHKISFTVVDSAKNSQMATVIVNVVREIVKFNIIPTNFAGTTSTIPVENLKALYSQVQDFYLGSSYGSLYLDFTIKPTVPIGERSSYADSPDETFRDKIIGDVLSKVYTQFPSNNNIIVLNTNEDIQAGTSNWIGTDIWADSRNHYANIIIDKNDNYGNLSHETGHSLGFNSMFSKTPKITDGKGNIMGTEILKDLYGDQWWDLMGTGNYVNPPTNHSSFAKMELNWLKPQQVSDGDIQLTPLEKSKFGDPVNIFQYDSSTAYIIEARDLPAGNHITGDVWPWNDRHLENGVELYKVEGIDFFSSGGLAGELAKSNWVINSINKEELYDPITNSWLHPTTIDDDPTLSTAADMSSMYIDLSNFVKFSIVSETNDPYYRPTVSISQPVKEAKNKVGDVLKGIKGSIKGLLGNTASIADPNATYPDLDLHAYTPDGKHVGMNYTSGLYEMQIPGANASGDMQDGEEWIFVPKGTKIRYSVSSYDVQKYLEEHSEIDPANATMNYTTSFMEYGENPQRVQLPDGNWTVTNRTVSVPKEDTIKPGVTKIIDNTPPAITITTPANTSYILKQPVIANWKAIDNESGIKSVNATVANGSLLDTSTVGTKIFSITATDNAENTANITVSYNVVYNYTLLKLGVSNTFVKGTPIAVRFQLEDANKKYISNAKARIYLAKVTKGVVGNEIAGTSVTKLIKDNQFKYVQLGKQYVFDLDTAKLSTGTWRIRIELDDGTSKYVNIELK